MPSGRLVDLDLIDEDPKNPRGTIDDVTDLKLSLAIRGQEEDLHLIPKPDGRFWLHEGHRRITAMRQLGWRQASYVERHFSSEKERRLSQGVLHHHRTNWDPIAWAHYCHDLYWTHHMERNEIARGLQVSPNWVRDIISLTNLEPAEQRDLAAGRMSKAEALRRLADRRAMLEWKRRGGHGEAPEPAADRKPAPSHAQAYFNAGHPLAKTVAARCEHPSGKISGLGCGLCWEAVIRDDALANANVTPLRNPRHRAGDLRTADVA